MRHGPAGRGGPRGHAVVPAEEIPAAPSERVQHDLHAVKCPGCGREHCAPRPASIRQPRSRSARGCVPCALPGRSPACPGRAVRQLIADVTGAAVSDGFIHSCLARASSLAAGTVAVIRALIAASRWRGSMRRRCGPARPGRRSTSTARSPSGSRRSGWAPAAWTPWRMPGSCRISRKSRSPTDKNYWNTRWEHISGHQACCAHLLRDFEDCATYPGAVWPVQAQRALRGMIHAWHAALDQGLPAVPADALKP